MPEKVQPERVRVEVVSTGQSITSALFRREADLPGPPIMVSSDAAKELGLQAGTTAELRVVALRKETVEVAPVNGAQISDTPADRQPEVSDAPETLETQVLDAILQSEAEGVDSAAAPTATEVAAATAVADDELQRPFVQVATVGSQGSADDLVKKLASGEVAAITRAVPSGDKTLYSVLAGPASNVPQRDALLTKVKGLGYADAFPTK